MSLGSMEGHMDTKNGKAAEARQSWTTTPTSEEPQTYQMDFPTAGGPQNCLVEGCPGRAVTRTAMRVHFLHRHVRDTVVILEEVTPPPHPR